MKLYSRVWRYIPVTLVMGIIFLLSHQEGPSLPLPQIAGIDKVAHGVAYAVLSATALYSFLPETRRRKASAIGVGVVLFCMLYGISDEFHQIFVPGRIASSGDLMADSVGAMLLVLCWLRFSGSGSREVS